VRRVLVGRAGPLQEIAEALDLLEHGRGGALAVVGPSGVGRSALLRAAADMAAAREMVVVAVDVADGERRVPWSTLSTAVAPFRRLLTELDPGVAKAMSGLGGEVSHGANPIEWFEIAMGALALLSQAASTHPLVLVVDDADRADEVSRAALASIARRLGNEPVLIVVSRDPDAPDPRIPGPVIRLGALDRAAADELLCTIGVTADAARERIFAASRGIPGALVDLAHQLTADQRAGIAPLPDPLAVGQSTERRYAERLGRLSDRERAALLVAATDTSEEVSVVTDALARLGEDLAVLEPAEEHGLVAIEPGRIRFEHPLARSVVYYRATPAARRRAHDALAAVEKDEERAVWHRMRGVVGQDADVAAAVDELAERTSLTGALSTASELFRNAATLTPDMPTRARRWLRAAELSLAAGDGRRARADLIEVPPSARTNDAELDVTAATIEARIAVVDDDMPAAIAIAREHLPLALANPSVTSDTAADLAFTVVGPAMHLGRFDVAIELAAQVASLLDGDVPLTAATRAKARIARAVVQRLGGNAHQAPPDLDAWRDLLAASGPSSAGLLCETVAVIYSQSNRKDAAAAMLDELESAARQACSPGGLIPVLVVRAVNAYGVDLAQAVRYADEAIALGEETDQPGTARAAWHTLVLALSAQMDERRCRAVAETMLASPLGSLVLPLASLGKLELSLGNLDAAIAMFAELAALPGELPGEFVYHSDLAEALIRAGRGDEAGPALAVLERQAQGGRIWARAQLHRLAALSATGDEAGRLFELARAGFIENRNLYALALTELQWGEHLRRIRRRGQARPLLESARDRFEQIGAWGWLPRVDRELVAAGAVPSAAANGDASTRLTSSELEIARRVAAGESTRDVARQLFLSPRTVETHLSVIYRKLGVRGRAGLAVRARDDAALR
jgi:DNA-binding CsgD family transcriptional regulator